MVFYRYRQKCAFQMKNFKKKTEKNLVLKYSEIRYNVSTIPWSYKKKIVNYQARYNTLQLNLLNSIDTHAYITHTSTYTLLN